jgi:hypothetical protein
MQWRLWCCECHEPCSVCACTDVRLHDERRRCADNTGRLWQYMQRPWVCAMLFRWLALNMVGCKYNQKYVCMVCMHDLYACMYVCVHVWLAVNTLKCMYVWYVCIICIYMSHLYNISHSQVCSNQQVCERALQIFERMSTTRHSDKKRCCTSLWFM